MAQTYLLIAALSLTLTIKDKPKDMPPSLGTCSAVMISPTLVLSAAHCIHPATTQVWAKLPDGRVYEMDFVQKDVLKDLVLMRFHYKPKNVKFTELGYLPHITDSVYIVSAADGMSGTYTEGYISNLIYEGFQHLIVHSAPILPGSSGSGLFDGQGKLIGINTLFYKNTSYAVSVEDIRAFLTEYRN